MKIQELLTESSPMGKMGFPKDFIKMIYQGSNLQHSEQPVPLEGKPKAADFRDSVVIAKGRDGKMYAVRWADKNYGGRDGAILYTWDHENGTNGGEYTTFTKALTPMKSGTEFWKIPLDGYDRGRGNTQVDRNRGKNEQLQWETLDYMNQTFLPQLKGRIEEYLDYIYANLRKLKSEKRYSYDSTEQERALSAANALQDIADKGFNKETVKQFLYANNMGDSGWGSYYRNQENFAELMNTKPAARAEFAKMVFNSAKSLYNSVKEMVYKPVTDKLK